jgi:hypothetical protein
LASSSIHHTTKGDFDGDTDLLYLVGVNFNYELNPHLAFEAGYNWDKLDSDLTNRSYTRNRAICRYSRQLLAFESQNVREAGT